ncbi:MAG: trypsin-like peptidase domain-containing protein [Deltaproteobacteria bacterium]|nr:trypsin-like peptidase domain-containing protein [Deltaproteobacteria bacterium]
MNLRKFMSFALAFGVLLNCGYVLAKIPPHISRVAAPPVKNSVLIARERQRRLQTEAEGGIPKPVQLSEPLVLHISPDNSGTWEILPDGRALWRVVIESEGALNISAAFSRFVLPDGAELNVFDKFGSHQYGPYTKKRNKASGKMWLPRVNGDQMMLEITLPQSSKSNLELETENIIHGFEPIIKDVNSTCTPGGPYYDPIAYPNGCEGSLYCNIDVACIHDDPWNNVGSVLPSNVDWDQLKRSVVNLDFLSGLANCSGVLVNNTDDPGKLLVLTAGHCISATMERAQDLGIPNMDTWDKVVDSMQVYWNYENSSCRDYITPRSILNEVGDGGTQMVTGPGGDLLLHHNTVDPYYDDDIALIELVDHDVDDIACFRPYFAGWDSTGSVSGMQPVVGIHHARGAEKRISVNISTTLEPMTGDPYGFGYADYSFSEEVDFDYGATEHGSSGSPLFSPAGKVVGIAHSGLDDSCPPADGTDYALVSYYWSPSSLTPKLEDHLAPGSSVNELSGYDPPYDASDCDNDLDGVFGNYDNCPNHPNFLQRDCDGDGLGDICDAVSSCSYQMMMVVDESGSMDEEDGYSKAKRYQHAYAGGAATIVDNWMQPGDVFMGIMDFNDDPGCVSGGSTSIECELVNVKEPQDGVSSPDPGDINDYKAAWLAERFFDKYDEPNGFTDLITAIDNGVQSLKNAAGGTNGEQMLFLLTDGKQTVDKSGDNLGDYIERYGLDFGMGQAIIELTDEIMSYRDETIGKIENEGIKVSALAVTHEADIEMLEAFADATNGFVGYANSSSDIPVYWANIQSMTHDSLATLDIGDIKSPWNIVLEQEADDNGQRAFEVSEDATMLTVILSSGGYNMPEYDGPITWDPTFLLKSPGGYTAITASNMPPHARVDSNTIVLNVPNPESGTWTLSSGTPLGRSHELWINYIAIETTPSATVKTEVDKTIIQDGEFASITPTVVYKGIPLDTNTTNCIVKEVAGPEDMVIRHGDSNAFVFTNTPERIMQGLPPIAVIMPFNGRGFYTVHIECDVDDSSQSVPGTSLTDVINPVKHTSSVTIFADIPEMPTCDSADCDHDTIINEIEGDEDLDLDGWPNYYDSDSDGDEVPDQIDKCPYVFNPDQTDSDLDGIGDACDADTTCMFGTEGVWVSDRSVLDTMIGSNEYIELGADAAITGVLKSGGDVFMRERSVVTGHVWAGGILETQNDTSVSGDVYEGAQVDEMSFAPRTVDYGIVNVDVSSQYGCAQTIDAGAYGNITVHAGCTLTLQPGIYDVLSFNVYADGELQLNGNVELNVESLFQFGDRSTVEGIVSPAQFLVYSNQQSQLRIGVDADFTGHILAPNADVAIFTHATVEGCTHSKTLHIEPEVELIGEEFPAPKCGNGTVDDGEACDDGNASNNDACLTTCQVATCDDGFWNESEETDVDCGGVCAPCAMNKNCTVDADCVSGICDSGVCDGNLTIDASVTAYYPWYGKYCANVTITNSGAEDVSSWRVQLLTGGAQIVSGWNATFTMMGDELSVEGNALPAGQSKTAGFCTYWYPSNPVVVDTLAY